MISAVIFDFDGVIVDSEKIHKKTFEDLLGLSISDERWYIEFAGTGSKRIFSKLIEENNLKLDADSLVEKRMGLFEEYVDQGEIQLMPGIFEFLHLLEKRHIKTAIASGGHSGYIDKIINQYQFVFDFIVSADDIPYRKPDPRVFLYASKNLDVEPEECVVFEDSYSGAQAAIDARMKLVWFQTYPSLIAPKCDLVVKDFVDPKIIDLIL